MRLKTWLVVACIVSLAFGPIWPPAAFGQYLGQVTIATVQAQLAASNTSCTGNAQNFITNQGIPNFNNLGQTFHQVSATSSANSFTVEIDGIDVLGNVVRISNPTVQFQPSVSITGYVAQGNGYYPNIQVSVTCTLGGTFSMTYSGSSGGSSPIIATPGVNPVPSGSVAANVEGFVPTGQNGNAIYPVIIGGMDPATNAQVQAMGIDTFSSGGAFIGNGITSPGGCASPGVPCSPNLATPPQPSAPAGEFAFAFYGPIRSVGFTTVASPWTCQVGCTSQINGLNIATLANYTQKNTLQQFYTNSTNTTVGVVFVAFAKAPTISHLASASSNSTSITVSNTGDTILVGFNCSQAASTTCGAISVADTFGSAFKTIPFTAVGNNFVGSNEIYNVFSAISAGSGADTVTVTQAGTAQNIALFDLTNIVAAPPNTVSAPLFTSNQKAQTNEDDNGVLFTGNGSFDYTQTVTLTPAGTTTFPLWSQTQNGVLYDCTVALRVTAASGTTPTLNTYLQDSADNVGFNDRLSFPQATAAANYLGAVSGGSGGITPAVTTDGSLAVATKVDGPLSAFGRIKFVVAGTTPSFTVTYNVACR